MKTIRKVFALFLASMLVLSVATFSLTAHAENAQITLNTEDTHTFIDTAALGYSDAVKSLGYGESLTFDLVVPESAASIYLVRMRGSTTGQSVYVIIKDASGNAVFSKFHTMNYKGENVSGKAATEVDGSDATVNLPAGSYSVLIMNGTEGSSYGFQSLELRNILMPLGTEPTAFNATDSYYYAILQYHYNDFTSPATAPEGYKAVGGNDFYAVHLDANQSNPKPDLRYYVKAETGGQYKLSMRHKGHGGYKLSVNGNAAVDIFPYVTDAFDYKTETSSVYVSLVKGLNDLHISGGGKGGNALSAFDCFMLEPVNSIVSLNTEDTHTLIKPEDIGYSGTSVSLAKDESISFKLKVTDQTASTYQAILSATKDATVSLNITAEDGTAVFSKTQKMGRNMDFFSGAAYQQKVYDGVQIPLAEGVYTVTLTNTTDVVCNFKSIEFRNIILPLGSEYTAFHSLDAYYRDISFWHDTSMDTLFAGPDGAKAVGGNNNFSIVAFQENAKPSLRFYVNAKTSGLYKFSIYQTGFGGLKASVNGGTAFTISEKTTSAISSGYYNCVKTDYAELIQLNAGINTIEFSGGCAGNSNLTCLSAFMLKLETEIDGRIPLNTEDTHTVISVTDMGFSATPASLAQNESASFQLKVTEKTAGTYLARIHGTTTGQELKLDIKDATGKSVFSKTQDMTRKTDTFTGVYQTGVDDDGCNIPFTAGTYTVTLTNLSETAYGLESVEFRNLILPLGSTLTAFNMMDAYYMHLNHWHCADFASSSVGPEGAKAVGGNAFCDIAMDAKQSVVPEIRYYIYAETGGQYRLSMRTYGHGGLKASVNNADAVTVLPYTETAYEKRIDAYQNAFTLNQGLNTIVFSGGGNGGNALTFIDCFMLEKVMPEVTLNTEDTNTMITADRIGYPGGTATLAKNDAVSFQLVVPEGKDSKYISILRSNGTGALVNLKVTAANGSTVFDGTQDVLRVNELFSGVEGQGYDNDSAVMELAAGTYAVTVTNLSDTAYGFKSLELRNVILPLGDGLTAFRISDAYYQKLLYWHACDYTSALSVPEGAKAVGGNDYYSIIMEEGQNPDLRYYIYAEKAGIYEVYTRSSGRGNVFMQVNGGDTIAVLPITTEAYTQKIEKYEGTITLKQGLNTLVLSGGGPGGGNETSIDCFMLNRVELIWPENNALTYTADEDSVTLSWNPVSTMNVMAWEIYKDGTVVATNATDELTYTIGGLQPATTYELKVKAIMSGTAYDAERTIFVATESFAARENTFRQIAAGKTHFVGVNKNGKLQTFGGNHFEQTASCIPADIQTVGAGALTSYAVDQKGNAFAWGGNAYGQAGVGSDDLIIAAPVQINLADVVQITGGTNHALALTKNGEVYAWGDNRYGQLGTANTSTVSGTNAPVLVSALSGKAVVSVSAGPDISFAICADGSLYAWGINYSGQLGNGDAKFDPKDAPIPVSLPGKALSVSAGSGHTVCLVYTDGNNNNLFDAGEATFVYAWGVDNRGQLATGDLTGKHNMPVHIPALDGKAIISVVAGDGHNLALSSDGTVYGWGWNEDGQLGVGDCLPRFDVVKIGNLPKIVSISAGYAYSVALSEHGAVYAWGNNNSGQVADTDVPCYMAPVATNLPLGDVCFGNLKLGEADVLPENGGAYTISATCYNASDVSYSGTVRICVYTVTDGKLQLQSVVPCELSLAAKERKPISEIIEIPEDTENALVKIFAWDTGLNPHSEVAIIQ